MKQMMLVIMSVVRMETSSSRILTVPETYNMYENQTIPYSTLGSSAI